MPEDVKIDVGFDVDVKNIKDLKSLLSETKKLADSIEIKDPKQAAKAKNATTAASLALEGELTSAKVKAFKENIQIVFDIIGKAAKMGNKINTEYEALERKIKALKEEKGNIRGNISTLTERVRTKKYASDEAVVLFDVGRQQDQNDPLTGRASAEIIADYIEVLKNIDYDFRKLTDDIAKHSSFGSKENIKYVRDTIEKGAGKTIEENKEKQQGIGQEIKDLEEKLKTMSPVVAEDNKVLEQFIKNLYKIQGISSEMTSQATTEVKNKEHLNASPNVSTGGVIDVSNNINKQTSSLGKAFKAFTLYHVVVRNARRALREAIRTVKELDKALTEQAMVTGLTRKQTYELLGTYQNMAKSLGATTKEVSSTMTAFLRQGRSITESTKLTEAAVAAAKVASISTADSVNYLTTAINGFRLSASDAMKVSDKFAAVAATAATSYEEIAIAMSKVAAQANLAGMSIDYTTALLTKGLETTREAPETIGTALKTVIARMRELTDYGATLEDGTDINNVETQLAYVGIQLRDNNGELRSTEDVLNELGQQWDDLNANQQAAVAKALAGTRQQSRLIAMMSDYERVIELQEIAERSQGATMAQMATYLEGMDAALNNVRVAWEEIVSAVTNSDVIIGVVNAFSNILDILGKILQWTPALVTVLFVISNIMLSHLSYKLQEWKINRQNLKISQNQTLEDLKQKKAKQDEYVINLKNKKIELENLITARKERKEAELKANWERQDVSYKTKAANAKKIEAEADTEINELERQRNEINDEYTKALDVQDSLQASISLETQKMQTTIFGIISGVSTLVHLLKILKAGWIAGNAIHQQKLGLIKAEQAEQTKLNALQGQGMAAKIIAAFASLGPWGVALGLATATAIATALGFAIHAAVTGGFKENKSADEINNMSADIYNLNKKATELDTTISKFDELDKKVLKTNEDLKEMSNLLESAADSLSEEEKKEFEDIQTDRERRNYLERVVANTNNELRNKRAEQRDKILNLSEKDTNKLLTSNESEWIKARDAMYTQNNQYLYEHLDSLKADKELTAEQALETQHLTQAMLEELKAEDALDLLKNPNKVYEYTRAIKDQIKAWDDITTSEKRELTLREQAIGYMNIYNQLAGEAKEAFAQANQEWLNFAKLTGEKFGKAIEYMDEHWGGSIDKINTMASAIQDLGHSADDSLTLMGELAQSLEEGNSLREAIESTFGVLEGTDAYKKLLNTYSKTFGTTLLNMGQNMTKFQNKIDNFYENVGKWNSMSDQEQTSFIQENLGMFEGEKGLKLLGALEKGNYQELQELLSDNTGLKEERLQLLQDIEDQLLIAEANNDLVEIAKLNEYKKHLNDIDNLYLASLETRLEQENKQLDAYKDYLNKQKEALEKSLNDRKDAYQKYFDTINQEAEDEEYEEQASMLVANLSKLASSNNMNAQAQSKELEKQLQDLEKERLQTLRERAQEQVISSIEDEVTAINDKFDKLLDSNQLLLQAMLSDASSPTEFASNMLGTTLAGASYLEAESALATFKSTFSNLIGDLGNSMSVTEENGNVILNIQGQEFNLTTSESKDIIDAVQKAMRQLNQNNRIR